MQTDITVLGGLPVTIGYEIEGADPYAGLKAGVSEWWITHINGRKVRTPEWLYKRISAMSGEGDRILQKLNELVDSPCDHYDPYDWDTP